MWLSIYTIHTKLCSCSSWLHWPELITLQVLTGDGFLATDATEVTVSEVPVYVWYIVGAVAIAAVAVIVTLVAIICRRQKKTWLVIIIQLSRTHRCFKL